MRSLRPSYQGVALSLPSALGPATPSGPVHDNPAAFSSGDCGPSPIQAHAAQDGPLAAEIPSSAARGAEITSQHSGHSVSRPACGGCGLSGTGVCSAPIRAAGGDGSGVDNACTSMSADGDGSTCSTCGDGSCGGGATGGGYGSVVVATGGSGCELPLERRERSGCCDGSSCTSIAPAARTSCWVTLNHPDADTGESSCIFNSSSQRCRGQAAGGRWQGSAGSVQSALRSLLVLLCFLGNVERAAGGGGAGVVAHGAAAGPNAPVASYGGAPWAAGAAGAPSIRTAADKTANGNKDRKEAAAADAPRPAGGADVEAGIEAGDGDEASVKREGTAPQPGSSTLLGAAPTVTKGEADSAPKTVPADPAAGVAAVGVAAPTAVAGTSVNSAAATVPTAASAGGGANSGASSGASGGANGGASGGASGGTSGGSTGGASGAPSGGASGGGNGSANSSTSSDARGRVSGGASGFATRGAPSCTAPRPLADDVFVSWQCKEFQKMCVDEQQFISYDPKYQGEELPGFGVSDITYNYPNPFGNGDKFATGSGIHTPPVEIRVNTSEEACPDLQHPVFSSCTHPLVLWQRYMYNVGETFETTVVRMHGAAAAGSLDPRLTLVVATPHGLRLPRYWSVFMGAFFQRPAATLADFSARRHYSREPSNSTAEGWQVRCFERLTMCKLPKRQKEGMTAAGAHLLRHYAPQLPSIADVFDAEGADRDVLKVVFASRPNATGRVILNEAELLTACNKLNPAEAGRGRYRRVKCVAYVFGRDLFHDLALAKAADVLVATHGAAGYHSFYMGQGSSFVEVLPLNFPRKWANVYYARMLEYEKKVFYWAIYILDPVNSKASELQAWPTFRKTMRSRERHVSLPWAALRQHLLAILRVGGNSMSYKAAYVASEHCISDTLKRLYHFPNATGLGWANYTGTGNGAALPR